MKRPTIAAAPFAPCYPAAASWLASPHGFLVLDHLGNLMAFRFPILNPQDGSKHSPLSGRKAASADGAAADGAAAEKVESAFHPLKSVSPKWGPPTRLVLKGSTVGATPSACAMGPRSVPPQCAVRERLNDFSWPAANDPRSPNGSKSFGLIASCGNGTPRSPELRGYCALPSMSATFPARNGLLTPVSSHLRTLP
jgi:hypothetical protein